IADYVTLHLKHATQALLWHQFPDTAVVTHTFPNGSSLNTYTFNKTTPGVHGIEYNVTVDTSTTVEWAMMPVNGSNISISNSTIRSIGLWFTKKDTANVSGLVDNSNYTNFTAPLSDRNLQLINTSVHTWSAYTFNKSVVNFSGCILGEVGSMGTSKVTGNNYWVDGSGGYQWASDTSTYFNVNTTTSSNVRSEKHGFLIFAYSTENNGVASAIGKSILIVVQSVLPQDPVVYEGSDVWFDNIGQATPAYVDTVVSVIGSAWIDKGPTSQLMDFSSYQVFYQLSGDTTWKAITTKLTSEVRNNQLAAWNTHGLAAGNYILKVTLHDNWGDSVEAKKSINLLPGILVSAENIFAECNFNVYPNPFSESAFVQIKNRSLIANEVKIYNALGQEMNCKIISIPEGFIIHSANLAAGIYSLQIKTSNGVLCRKIIKE
ncbi:MAG TPA: T9SS type A sorting domain-containing protein, partial [Bacteroidia bacterium]